MLLLSVGPLLYWRRVSALKKEKAVQESFARALIEQQEKERKRIGAELHDSLGQSILIMKNHALMGLNGNPSDAKQSLHFQEISTEATDALDEVRKIAYNLRPHNLERFGLVESLKAMVSDIQKATHFDVHCEIENIDGAVRKDSEILVYRIVQESLNNAVKHANAASITLRIGKTTESVVISVEDDGAGFDADMTLATERSIGGSGLLGINERVRMMGGSLAVHSAKGEGTNVSVVIPSVTEH